jgi:peroxiredoxin
MKYPILFVSLFTILLSACTSNEDTFRLEGEFRNMNQAEFYLFDAASGKKDTISVQRGRFVYETSIPDTMTMMLIFPNYSMLPVFARNGITVTMKGDASNLKETKLTGSKENDEMTAFRLKANQLTPPEVREQAMQYIYDEPASPVSYYLLRRYFLQTIVPNYLEALRLCNIMLEATPDKEPIRILHNDLLKLIKGMEGMNAPRFAVLDRKNKIVSTHDLRSEVNVVVLWATWHYDSREQLKTLRKLSKKYPGRLAVMGIGIDADRYECNDWVRRDSIEFPLICDGKMWKTPLAHLYGLFDIPSNTVFDNKGTVLKRNIPTKELTQEIEKLLK